LLSCRGPLRGGLSKGVSAMPRRFKPPWTAEQIPGGYVVKDATGQALRGGCSGKSHIQSLAVSLTCLSGGGAPSMSVGKPWMMTPPRGFLLPQRVRGAARHEPAPLSPEAMVLATLLKRGTTRNWRGGKLRLNKFVPCEKSHSASANGGLRFFSRSGMVLSLRPKRSRHDAG